MDNLLFIYLRRIERLYMLSKYAHVKRIRSKQQFDMSLNGVFQPPNILSVPPNRLPPNKIPQPPNKKIFRAPREL